MERRSLRQSTVALADINGEESEDDYDTESDEDCDEDSDSNDSEDESSDSDECMEADDDEVEVRGVRWRRRSPDFLPSTDPVCQALPETYNRDTPLDFFSLFFTNDMFDLILLETQRLAGQKRLSRAPVIEKRDIEKYVGVVMLMGVIQIPGCRRYWASGTRVPQIANHVSRTKFDMVKSFLHFTDNTKLKKQGDNGYDPLQKVRPVLDMLLSEVRKVPHENRFAVDEMIIPFKGRSHMKQYNPKKPKKWGYKAQALCGASGILYNLEVYCGKGHGDNRLAEEPDLGASGNVVVRMLRHTPRDIHPKVFFDNWFSSIPLLSYLQKEGIGAVCTIRRDRIAGSSFSSDAEMKRAGRGSYEVRQASHDGIQVAVIKWQDKSSVHLASTYVSEEPVGHCERFDRTRREKVNVRRPHIVKEYNTFMGGVDKMDMLLALYRIKVRSRKYYMRIFYHVVNLAVVQAWLVYVRSRRQFHPERSREVMGLMDFQVQISEALIRKGAPEELRRNRGRPSLEDRLPTQEPSRGTVVPHPVTDVRRDNVAHWPMHVARGRCRYPDCSGFSSVGCEKCQVRLCFSSQKNCFKTYHTE